MNKNLSLTSVLAVLLLGVSVSQMTKAMTSKVNCRVIWSDFSHALKQKNRTLSLRHVIPKNSSSQNIKYCRLDEEAGKLTILPFGPEDHFCELRFPAVSKKLKNDWFIQRLDVLAGGARWRMKRDHGTGGFVLNLQGDNRRSYSLRITSLYLRNQKNNASCQNVGNGWKMLF